MVAYAKFGNEKCNSPVMVAYKLVADKRKETTGFRVVKLI